jgi:D-threo-aldose 1-dehydrogenase
MGTGMKASDTVPLRAERPVTLTRMGFGGAAIGNLYRKVSDEDAHGALLAAWDAGIRTFDTAPQYGLGLSERRVGAALAKVGRDGATISTKVGRLLVDCAPDEVTPEAFVHVPQKRIVYDYSYDGVMRSHEASLARLGVERVDILLVHDVDAFTHGSREASDARVRELFDRGGYRALEALRADGRVKGDRRRGQRMGSLPDAARARRLRLLPARRPLHADRAGGAGELPASLRRA